MEDQERRPEEEREPEPGPPRTFAMRVLHYVPAPVAEAPERVLVNYACIMIGAAGLVAVRPGSLLELWPPWIAYEWAAAMFFGGLCALVGYLRGKLSLERLGYFLIAIACTAYAVAVLVVFDGSGIFPALIYAAIAVAKVIRLFVTSVTRQTMVFHAEQQKRDPGPP